MVNKNNPLLKLEEISYRFMHASKIPHLDLLFNDFHIYVPSNAV